MPPADCPTDAATRAPAEGEVASYRGRRRREPAVEVTEPVVLPEVVALAARAPQVVEQAASSQHLTRAEAKAAALAAARVTPRERRPTGPARSQRPAPATDNRRRAPQRRAIAPVQPRHRRGVALAVAASAVAALGGVAVAAGALPNRGAAQASAAFGPSPATAVGALDSQPRALTSEQSSASVLGDTRDEAFRMVAVSRSQERGPIAGCSGTAPTASYANGQLPTSILCLLPFAAPHRLRADAAVRLIRLNEVYKGQFGDDLCLTDSYRSLASQYSVAARKPGLAARPGTSEHGWGLAVDLCGGPEQPGSTRRAWLLKNAASFGWVNPDWAKPGGSKPEPWHWEFAEGE